MIFILKKNKLKNFANSCLQNALVIIFCILALNAFAQEFNMNSMPPPDMYMQYSAGPLSKDSRLVVEITIPDNWHVNANIAADEFLKPSSITVEAKGIFFGEPKWPEPIKEYSEALDLENLVFRGTFNVELPVDSVAEGFDSLSTVATFHYQACDNSICLAPAQKSIRLNAHEPGLKKNENPSKQAIKESGTAKAEALSETPTAQQASLIENSSSTLILLLFALFGGLILNLMPCVLPVLSLKLFSLIKEAGESRKRLVALGISTTAGILVSFWVLAAIVTVVKIGGGSVGWGMQFQSAGFIAFMVVVLSAFAMSFFGVFEVWLPGAALTQMDSAGRRQGLTGAFFTGALLVLLSTPCSAPFLGTAMGFAFTASTPVLFLFFTAAGLGLSTPYLLVCVFPAVLKVLPKPGAWMLTLQKVMGVLLFATVAWLLWIVSEQAGITGVILLAAVAIVSVVCSILLGKFAPPGSSFSREMGIAAGSALVIATVWFAVLSPLYENEISRRFEQRARQQMTEDGWYRYSPELIENFAREGRTVFVDVTADWCITCKANEAAVLNGEDFRHTMDSLNVALVKADWTRESPEVNALLKSMGKSGVPAYAIYPKGSVNKQIVLPELLTTGAIVEKLSR